MAELKRDLVKYIRDKAKSGYKKYSLCHICDTKENLEFHHYSGLTELLEKWLNGRKVDTSEEIMVIRDDFIEQHYTELYEDTVTLCKTHHLKLHSIYGKRPTLNTAPKQARWVEKQKAKNGMV